MFDTFLKNLISFFTKIACNHSQTHFKNYQKKSTSFDLSECISMNYMQTRESKPYAKKTHGLTHGNIDII